MPYAPDSATWKALNRQAAGLPEQSIADFLAAGPTRASRLSAEQGGLAVDFSLQLIDEPILGNLLQLADAAGVAAAIRSMFAGESINTTENRPALHIALRRSADRPLVIDGADVMAEVEFERQRVASFVARVHDGRLTGFTGRPIKDVVNIGIGGSDLGVAMVVGALAEYRQSDLGVHFVSNVDGVKLKQVMMSCDPESTLFVVCSKSFSTLETQTNADAARRWLIAAGGEVAVQQQFAAVSTNHAAMDKFGINTEQRFTMWDWVGGRYSVWSSVGLSAALAIGWENFEEFLGGGRAMDDHFETAGLEGNLPVLMAMVGVWNRNFLKLPALAILPYDQHLERWPAFLQQLEMESNGKQVRNNGEPVHCETCPIIFGEPGSNAQHSFFQLLHQGSPMVAVDFLVVAQSGIGAQYPQDLATANCLAQARALAEGRRPEEVRAAEADIDPALIAHKLYPGKKPSTLIAMARLTPRTLGALVALYEHKVYVQSVIWDINAFDQWGVELGKGLAEELIPLVASGGSTDSMILRGPLETVRKLRQQDS